MCVSCLVRLVCPSEFHSLLFIILTEELQIRIIKPDITSAISASESSLLFKSDNYKCEMILIHSSLGGLPDFSEIIQMGILQEKLIFIVKKLSGWYMEHYRAYDLKTLPSKEVELVEPQELHDIYPLVDYKIRGMRLVTLRRYVHV